jgi:predicted permease
MIARRALGTLLLLYPRSFRDVFGDEMLEVFAHRQADVRRCGGVAGVLALWGRTIPNVVRAALHERFRAHTGPAPQSHDVPQSRSTAHKSATDGIATRGRSGGAAPSRRAHPHGPASSPRGGGRAAASFPRLPRKRANPMERLLQDLRYGLRMLGRNPGFAVVAVITLALGIGVNTVVFSVVNALLLRPLPLVEEPQRLVVMFTGEFDSVNVSSYMDYGDFAERNRSLSGFAAYKARAVDLTGEAGTTRVDGMLVSANYFDVLGVQPQLGRFFTPTDDDEPGAETVAVLSHELWQSSFGADPNVVGRTARLNGLSFTIVGVAPAGFRGVSLESRPQVFVPMMMQPHLMPSSGMLLDRRGWGGIYTVGRLAEGMSFEQARDDFAAIAGWLKETYPDYTGQREYRLAPLPQATLTPSDRAVVVRFSGLLTGMMALVLLVACVNVANLMLSRALRRQREFAVRQALGAGRGRLVRQMLLESLLLSAIGGAAGLMLAYAASGVLERLPFPMALDFGFDGRMLAFVAAVTLLTGIGFGAMPTLRATRVDLARRMQADGGSRRPRRFRLGGALVVAQVALSLVLLIAAGLFLRTLLVLGSSDLGFDPDGVVTATIDPSLQGYGESEIDAFYRRALDRVAGIPGVESVSMTSALPADGDDSMGITIEGIERPEGGLYIGTIAVGADYFETLRIPMLRGRGFTRSDADRGERLLVLNETGAELLARYYPGDPLDARISFEGPGGPWLRVIGIAADSKTASLREEERPVAYGGPFAASSMSIIARTAGVPPARVAPDLRAALSEVDGNVPAFEVGTLEEHLSTVLLPERLTAALLGFAATLALALASVGLYGVLSTAVVRRTREMGIRMALGAHTGAVRRLVLGRALLLVALGAIVGIGGSLALGSVMASFLYGVTPTDPATYTAVIALLVVVALAAAYVPARRATRVDPLVALRSD